MGKVDAVPANIEGQHGFVHQLIGNWFNLPIYAAAWHHRYLLPDIPTGGLFVPCNPVRGDA